MTTTPANRFRYGRTPTREEVNFKESAESGERLKPIPVTLQTARAFIAWTHGHLPPPQRATFVIGVATDDGTLVGVVIAGRPVARSFDDGFTVEVTRLATDGTANACSALLTAAWRAARAMGHRRLITYTLATEPGTSLRAAGLRWVAERPGLEHPQPPRATHGADGVARVLWEITASFPGEGGAR
ncbi:XF1762 family protein [Microtetraspora malaysiensis]|uniref:XF1762 family protein n=1 Tax=Microtetraspora malaysiensis TaxID=161358 RepID=A0ABW6SYB5_9ACTN